MRETDDFVSTRRQDTAPAKVTMVMLKRPATAITGNRLSGGRRQRIGVARALLIDTDIVVLDEATASADPESGRAIRRGLVRPSAGRDRTHDRSPVAHRDRCRPDRRREGRTHHRIRTPPPTHRRRRNVRRSPESGNTR
ncbi:ATP-binding cassette domain-containing protein [Corynebacterium sp. P7003]|uniref:ATP-binding cassette domain-containing protein n=1 Tax=Corynebacterium pygosceleis TaxID=2800406 RepID=A0ABT3WX19_9CORY|nr:ATP-binding cassette domain-containing protein [Corynebacterium pygosceleis]MCX7445534.1 ATP-binding cassette domain-containing protein [Corynebacterium pygosceleis]